MELVWDEFFALEGLKLAVMSRGGWASATAAAVVMASTENMAGKTMAQLAVMKALPTVPVLAPPTAVAATG